MEPATPRQPPGNSPGRRRRIPLEQAYAEGPRYPGSLIVAAAKNRAEDWREKYAARRAGEPPGRAQRARAWLVPRLLAIEGLLLGGAALGLLAALVGRTYLQERVEDLYRRQERRRHYEAACLARASDMATLQHSAAFWGAQAAAAEARLRGRGEWAAARGREAAAAAAAEAHWRAWCGCAVGGGRSGGSSDEAKVRRDAAADGSSSSSSSSSSSGSSSSSDRVCSERQIQGMAPSAQETSGTGPRAWVCAWQLPRIAARAAAARAASDAAQQSLGHWDWVREVAGSLVKAAASELEVQEVALMRDVARLAAWQQLPHSDPVAAWSAALPPGGGSGLTALTELFGGPAAAAAAAEGGAADEEAARAVGGEAAAAAAAVGASNTNSSSSGGGGGSSSGSSDTISSGGGWHLQAVFRVPVWVPDALQAGESPPDGWPQGLEVLKGLEGLRDALQKAATLEGWEGLLGAEEAPLPSSPKSPKPGGALTKAAEPHAAAAAAEADGLSRGAGLPPPGRAASAAPTGASPPAAVAAAPASGGALVTL